MLINQFGVLTSKLQEGQGTWEFNGERKRFQVSIESYKGGLSNNRKLRREITVGVTSIIVVDDCSFDHSIAANG